MLLFSPHTRNSNIIANGLISSTLTAGWRKELLLILDDILTYYNVNDSETADEILSTFRVNLDKYMSTPSSIKDWLPNEITSVLDKFGFQHDPDFMKNLFRYMV